MVKWCSSWGCPRAGKSTFAQSLVAQGYHRLNRDEAGGTLKQLLPALDAALETGASRVVLDNTYVSRKSRAEVIRAASARGFPVRCIWLSTDVEEAQTNAVGRIVSRYGRLPDERELKLLSKHDMTAFLPSVQFRYRRELEPPDVSEGFSRVDVVPFERRSDPSSFNRALIVWCDGVLVRSRSGQRMPLTPDDVEVFQERAEILRRYQDDGFLLLGLSWQPEVAEGAQTGEGVEAVAQRMRELLGIEMNRILPACRGAAAVLVPEAAARSWRVARATASTGSRAVHLRRRRCAGSRLCATPRLRLPRGERLL